MLDLRFLLKKETLILALWALLPAFHLPLAAGAQGVDVRAEGGMAILENTRLRVEFDLAKGEYRAFDRADPAAGFDGAHLQINDWAANAPGVQHTWRAAPVTDPLGSGKSLIIASAAPGRPTLLLNLTLYNDQTFLALAGGVEKAALPDVRVNEIHPLAGARAFPKLGAKRDWRLLNGEAGAGHSMVTTQTALESPNNLLLTFNASGKRRSLVLGGLTYHEFAKYACVGMPWTKQNRAEILGRLAPPGMRLAGYLDCGREAESAPGAVNLSLVQGTPYSFGVGGVAPAAFASIYFDNHAVELAAAGLDPQKQYLLGFSWWDYDAGKRTESVIVTGADGQARRLLAARLLPDYKKSKKLPEMQALPLPAAAYAQGKLKIAFQLDSGVNAAVSEVWLWEAPGGDARSAVPAPWGPLAIDAGAPAPDPNQAPPIDLYAADPVGRLVDAPGAWMPDERFYVDFTTPDPFTALERYGLGVRAAMQARPNLYDFPTVCGWYVMMKNYGGGPNINHSSGMVDEMEAIVRSGFLKYSKAAVRLVPDTYSDDNEQGWWDEAHWQKYGHYTAPFETTAKWAAAVNKLGGIAETYFQTGFISLDYAKAHPGHFLFNDVSTAVNAKGHRNNACSFDYTDPAFRKHVAEVWDGQRRGGVRGVMFDYPDTGWHPKGGFEDKHATTAAAYRAIFELAKRGLGPNSYIHERNIGSQPFLDVTVGAADSQRVWGDSDLPLPEMYARCALRWYKTRVLYTYDMDAKNFFKTLPVNRDGVRQMLTMCTLTGGRLLLANSFRQLTPEQLHDLSRVYPLYAETKSPRPIDLFTGGALPRVYDLEVAPGWHEVIFWNTDAKLAGAVGAALSAPPAEGGLGLDRQKSYYVYDFWNDGFVGKIAGAGRLEQTLRPGEARVLAVHEALAYPQFIATDRHVLQGAVDLVQTAWDDSARRLSGRSRVIGSELYKVVIATNGFPVKSARAEGAQASIKTTNEQPGIVALTLAAEQNTTVDWAVEFEER